MKIGLDIHGVIDRYPVEISLFAKREINQGNEIHIITGQERDATEPLVTSLGVPFTHFFSIVDYHKQIGTEMWKDYKNTWWMDNKLWIRTKGDYCREHKIDVHFDDSLEYAQFMPDTCCFIHIPRRATLGGNIFLSIL